MVVIYSASAKMCGSFVIFEVVFVLEAFRALMTEPGFVEVVGGGEVVGLLRLGCEVRWADDASVCVLGDRHVE